MCIVLGLEDGGSSTSAHAAPWIRMPSLGRRLTLLKRVTVNSTLLPFFLSVSLWAQQEIYAVI